MTDQPDGAPEHRFLLLDAAGLSAEALRGLVEEFVSRDGTDYGNLEKTLDEKVSVVMRQLEDGEVCLVFDREEERANLVPARDLEDSLG